MPQSARPQGAPRADGDILSNCRGKVTFYDATNSLSKYCNIVRFVCTVGHGGSILSSSNHR